MSYKKVSFNLLKNIGTKENNCVYSVDNKSFFLQTEVTNSNQDKEINLSISFLFHTKELEEAGKKIMEQKHKSHNYISLLSYENENDNQSHFSAKRENDHISVIIKHNYLLYFFIISKEYEKSFFKNIFSYSPEDVADQYYKTLESF